jgi:hypothetical protein
VRELHCDKFLHTTSPLLVVVDSLSTILTPQREHLTIFSIAGVLGVVVPSRVEAPLSGKLDFRLKMKSSQTMAAIKIPKITFPTIFLPRYRATLIPHYGAYKVSKRYFSTNARSITK